MLPGPIESSETVIVTVATVDWALPSLALSASFASTLERDGILPAIPDLRQHSHALVEQPLGPPEVAVEDRQPALMHQVDADVASVVGSATERQSLVEQRPGSAM